MFVAIVRNRRCFGNEGHSIILQRQDEGNALMMQTIQCVKCGKEFALEGGNSNADQVPRTIRCPYCKEPNQVLWPAGMGYRVQTLPR